MPGDFSEENNGREEGSYRTIQGKVSFNNKSWNTPISSQETELEELIFPLSEP